MTGFAKIDKIDIENVAQVNKIDKMLHKCEECGFEAEDKYHVQRHAEAVHLGLKNIKCDQGGDCSHETFATFFDPFLKMSGFVDFKGCI